MAAAYQLVAVVTEAEWLFHPEKVFQALVNASLCIKKLLQESNQQEHSVSITE